ncbi:hypothetical protein [Pedobacter panaciterrae]
METTNQQTNNQRKKKFLLMLPVLVVPFLTLGFYALGGGKGGKPIVQENGKGLNRDLPDAHLEDKAMDKMAYYDKASTDSVQRRKDNINDPYSQNQQPPAGGVLQGYPGSLSNVQDRNHGNDNEARIYEKLGALNNAINQQQSYSPQQGGRYSNPRQQSNIDQESINRLEQMMSSMQENGNSNDPETKQLNSMLEKILDIQHPERVKEKIKQSEDNRKGQVYTVTTAGQKDRISLLESGEVRTDAGFQGGTGFLDWKPTQLIPSHKMP